MQQLGLFVSQEGGGREGKKRGIADEVSTLVTYKGGRMFVCWRTKNSAEELWSTWIDVKINIITLLFFFSLLVL